MSEDEDRCEPVKSKFHVHSMSIALPPLGTRPLGTMYLSSIDQHLSYYVRSLFFFRNSPGEGVLVEKLKNSLSKLLVPYNFYAGRLRLNNDNGRLELECNNAGALFAAATSSLSTQEVTDAEFDGFFIEPSAFANIASLDKLPLLTLQVTSMSNDEYAIGVMNHHIGADAASGTYMIMNLACIARGEELLFIPEFDREQLKVKDGQNKFVHSEFSVAYAKKNEQVPQFSVSQGGSWSRMIVESESTRKNLALATNMNRKTYNFTSQKLTQLKAKVLEAKVLDGDASSMITTFEVLAAFVWKAHSKAKFHNSDGTESVKLQFVADVRNILEPPLGIDFCGNAYYPVSTDQITLDTLVNESLSATVDRIQRAKRMLSDEYVRSGWEYLEAHPQYWYHHDCTTVINAWPRVMHKVLDLDFGWGKPHRVEYPRDPRNTKVFFFPFTKNGLIVSVCLEPAQFVEFEKCIGQNF